MIAITIDGKRWPIHNLDAIVIRWADTAPAARPRVLRACERCKRICVLLADECRCCAKYKTKSGGDTASFYPEDGKHHVDVMPMQQFIDRIRELQGVA